MKYIHIHCGNGYCTCNLEEPMAIEDEMTEEEINSMVSDMAYENAESFAYVHFGWDRNYSEEDSEEYLENHIEMNWYYMDREEYLEDCQNYGTAPISENN